MKRSLFITCHALAALCVLLLAGAFPLMGAEAVYHSGAMVLVAALLFLLLLWAALRLLCGPRSKSRYALAWIHGALALLLVGVAIDATLGLRQSFVMVTHSHEPVTELRTERGERIPLGCALTLRGFEVGHYQTTGQVSSYVADVQVDGESEVQHITVNKPLHRAGWIFSLQDYRSIRGIAMVRFQARRAPGRLMVRTGVAAALIGLFVWCWNRRKEETC